jgi:Zn finger protein HypA/HybF involved in hydrogenase expression
MHEVSLVADLIDVCRAQAAGRRVQTVRVRHATTIPADALEQAFRMLTAGGPLADATLDAERFDVVLRCPCGFDGSVGHDDVVGSVAICPACGLVTTLRRTAELELVELVTTGA